MKAILVFCEGSSDVVFTTRSLGAVANCSWVNDTISKLPSPFGNGKIARKGLIASRLEQRAFDDLSLQSAANPPLPSFEAIVKGADPETMFVLVRTNGKDQVDAVQHMLRVLQVTFDETHVDEYGVSEYATAFLLDANTIGVSATVNQFRQRYESHFGDLSGVDHSRWATTDVSPVGCFVFHAETEDQTGTLEDHLAPMVQAEWPSRYAKALEFIHENRNDSDKVSRNRASQLKAVITAAGQFHVPGADLTRVIGRDGRLRNTAFEQSLLSRDLVSFLKTAPWERQ